MDMGNETSKLIEMDGVEVNMQMTGVQTGTAEVDETTGWMIRSNTKMKFTGAVKMPPNPQMPEGMSIPMTIEGTAITESMDVK